jgi:hypothetical protein
VESNPKKTHQLRMRRRKKKGECLFEINWAFGEGKVAVRPGLLRLLAVIRRRLGDEPLVMGNVIVPGEEARYPNRVSKLVRFDGQFGLIQQAALNIHRAIRVANSQIEALVSDTNRRADRHLMRALLDTGRDDVYLLTETWNALGARRVFPLLPKKAWLPINRIKPPCIKYNMPSYFCIVALNEAKLDFGLVVEYDEPTTAHMTETWRELKLDYDRMVSLGSAIGLYEQEEIDHCHEIIADFVEAHPSFKTEMPARRNLDEVIPGGKGPHVESLWKD